ncbi:MAG: carboxypeptidase regulatory-like domain-containing protein [Acidobacteria bacterium]|nr:carboxypeptidase regulatory-like domain-containing protein [Acidobacteriota bacterium]
MRRNVLSVVLVAMLSALYSAPLIAQTATVKGTCRDAQGNPITDAQVMWQNQDNGRTYKLKTNKKGEYFSLGLDPGAYTVTLTKDGKVLDSQKNYRLGVDEVTYDIDLKQIQQQNIQDTAKKQGISAEQVKQQQEQAAKAEQYKATVNNVNAKLREATDLMHAQPPDYDKAIASLNEAQQMAPNEDVVYYRLGTAYLDSAKTQTDAAEKTKRNTEAYNDLQKAVDILKQKSGGQPQQGSPQGAPATQGAAAGKPPAQGASDSVKMAAYYDNLGAAAARLGKTDEAANAYKQAAEVDPAHAGNYYFNLGAVLTNSGTDQNAKKQAAEAFDKAIAADPSKADAYYWKGTNLIALASTDSQGKLSAPNGTAEAFQKYLELQPNGPHAEEAKSMLAALNQSVETSFGNKKTPPKKKP